ncbi:DMT family transporter [Granulosicoccaceae sp. 1_MG-2023]|nr:DMT family transporter [Granulosicoccaceae sp. 1_MG-2023]
MAADTGTAGSGSEVQVPSAAAALGMALAVASAAGFSMKAIFVKLAYVYGVDAETLLALRMAYSLPVFLAIGLFALWRGGYRLTRRDWLALLVLGFLGYYLASYLDFLGLNYISASLERLILFSYPTLVVLISVVYFGKALSRGMLVSLVVCYAGVGLAVGHDLMLAPGRAAVLTGAALVFGSALSYSLYIVGNAQVVHRIGAQHLTGWASSFACLISLGQFFAMRPVSALVQPWQVHAYAFGMAMLSTVLPVWCLSQAIRLIGAGKVALTANLGPVLTMGFAWLLLGEHLGAYQIGGAMLVIGGVLMVARENVRRA